MGIARRVMKLEQTAGIGICPECHGEGKYVVSYLNEHDPIPEVIGCPTCRKANRIIVRYVKKDVIQGADVQTTGKDMLRSGWEAREPCKA